MSTTKPAAALLVNAPAQTITVPSTATEIAVRLSYTPVGTAEGRAWIKGVSDQIATLRGTL